MSNRYTIRYLPIAVDDLLSILDWIAVDSPARAEAFVDMLDKRIRLLATHPFIGRKPRDEKLQHLGYRVLIIESYLVFYILRHRTIEIHRVVHGSRDLDDII